MTPTPPPGAKVPDFDDAVKRLYVAARIDPLDPIELKTWIRSALHAALTAALAGRE